MKCIDAIEGIAKNIFQNLHNVSVANRLDDSEYVRNVKAIIEAVKEYSMKNPEIIDNPELLENELYSYSRNLWLKNHLPNNLREDMSGEAKDESDEYQTYYYDYLYNLGLYPL
ncbi:MAG: hypothetical protein GY874_17010 [Desulfobacteraceae bacterium]|nr:hypothetical protein [Desulfobacteraceae bacterium]